MRLIDQIVQQRAPFLVQEANGTVVRLPGAGDFAAQVSACPLRFVLTDELTRTCTALAYSGGTPLADCLDLVHLPARSWWVEWNDAPRAEEFRRALGGTMAELGDAEVARAGAYIQGSADGRRGTLRKFWTSRSQPDDPLLAPLETHFDLDLQLPEAGSLQALLAGACTTVPIEADPAVRAVLNRARYCFDPDWLHYYQTRATTEQLQRWVLHKSLGAVATDLPLVVALLLLMTVRGGLPQRPADLARLNAKRARLGKACLLDHIEVSAPVTPSGARAGPPGGSGMLRRAARFHHVRGHIVRRSNAIFWRTPHWRGHLRMGQIRSRTVTLNA